jgi:hypothetical protein
VCRSWLSNHALVAVLSGLLGVGGLTAAVGHGVIEDRITNPLGESYSSLTVTLILPVLATTLLPVAWHDRVEASIALAARPLTWLRAAWWGLGVVAVCVALAPVRALVGSTQLGIDIGLLVGLATLVLCWLGLGPALTVPLLVLLPHLARRTGARPQWWTVLTAPPGPATGAVAVALAVAGVVTYALVGPRSAPGPAGGGAD